LQVAALDEHIAELQQKEASDIVLAEEREQAAASSASELPDPAPWLDELDCQVRQLTADFTARFEKATQRSLCGDPLPSGTMPGPARALRYLESTVGVVRERVVATKSRSKNLRKRLEQEASETTGLEVQLYERQARLEQLRRKSEEIGEERDAANVGKESLSQYVSMPPPALSPRAQHRVSSSLRLPASRSLHTRIPS